MWFFAPFGRGDVGSTGHDEAIEEFEILCDFIREAIAVWKDDGNPTGFLDGEDVGVGGEAGDADERGFECRGGFGLGTGSRGVASRFPQKEAEEGGDKDED